MSLSPQQALSIPIERFDELPSQSGVYILKDGDGTPVYVGKATSIKSRAQAHLRPKSEDPIGEALKNQIKSADYIVTQTPIEALHLENVLIKRHKPRYNIRLKDDKSYPYIRITSELYPRVLVTRQIVEDGSKYFGPYGNVRAAKRSVKYLRKLFPIRSCTLPLDGIKKFKSCLDYNLGLCNAPCIFAISRQEYYQDAKKFGMFLEGKLVQLSREMYSEMWKASKKQEFERARKLRDDIKSLETTALKQRIVFPNRREKDVVTVARKSDISAAVVFQVRNGKVVGREKFILEGVLPSSTDAEILSAFLKQYYGSPRAKVSEFPEEIVLPLALDDSSEVEILLRTIASKEIRISSAQKNLENRALLKLARENADLALSEEESKDEVRKRERFRGLKDLKEVLDLSKAPRRIECYDVSNIQGSDAVGAMTVFVDGFPEKNEYRKFRIKTVKGIDDFSMMAEMIGRRLRHLVEPGKHQGKKWDPPDLVVIDGGKGHLSAVLDQMHSDGVFGIPTISLAKREELIFVPKRALPIRLGRDSEALHILQHIRDEAHRFGLSYHRKLRGKKVNSSFLDEVEGIGETRKRKLLAHFGSIDGMRNSTVEEIAQAGELSKKLAQVILASLNKG